MSSTLGRESPTTDELDVGDLTQDRYSVNFRLGNDGEESTLNTASIDRYSTNRDYQSSKDGEESTMNGESFLHLSVTSESRSFDSRTYGTSTYVSEGSATLERSEYFDEELSLESHHMVMDRFVDSSCTCLDYPAMVYQTMCMETETSLLRESKGIPRSTIYNNPANAPSNLGIAAAKRRNVRIQNKDIPKDGQVNDTVSSTVHTRESADIQRMQIQPNKDFERLEGKKIESKTAPKNEPEKIGSDNQDIDNTSGLDAVSMSENCSKDSDDEIEERNKSEEVQSIANQRTKSMVERAIHNVAKEDEERDIKLDVNRGAEESNSNRTTESEGKSIENIKISKDPFYRGRHNSSAPATEQTLNDEIVHKNLEEKEIIDVISIDDQDSWTPGSRNEAGHYRHHQSRNLSQPNDPHVLSIPASASNPQDQHVDRRITSDSSTADDLWVEEEAKLSMRRSSDNRASSTSLSDLASAKSAEVLWNEERMKLQTISDVVVRSQSRRQLIQRVLKPGGEIRSTSAGQSLPSPARSRPSPDGYSAMELSQSASRERNMVNRSMIRQQGSGDALDTLPLSSRRKDLVAVRSIEEAQRIRAAKNTASHHKADINSYARDSISRSTYESLLREEPNQPELNAVVRSLSRQKSRSKDPTGRRSNALIEDPAKRFLLSEERDDQDSLPSTPPVGNKSIGAPNGKSWSDYDTALSATKELRKLEKKIERRVRRADLDAQMDQLKEKRRMEEKLSMKLRSIIKSDDTNTQKMSSKEIQKLEQHLTQALNSEGENRSSKLKRIKQKERQRFAQDPSNHYVPPALQQTNGYATTHTHLIKQYSQDSREKRPERSRYDDLKGLRARYARRGITRRSYSRVPESD